MRLLIRISFCCLLVASVLLAQRGGGARGGGGFRGGAFSGGVRSGGAYRGGGYRSYGGYRYGGYRYGGYRGYHRGSRSYYSYYPYWDGANWGFDLSLGYWPGYDPYYPNPYPYSGYATYQTSPNVTVIYPQAQSSTYANTSQAALRTYDEYGQEVRPEIAASGSASPLYLIAFNDHVIRPAVAYWVDGKTLHYVTLDHQQMQCALDTVDRALSLSLNRQRRVPFQLPAQ